MADSPDRGRTRKGGILRFLGAKGPVRLSVRFSWGGRGKRLSFRRRPRRADARRAVRFLTDARPAEHLHRGQKESQPGDIRERVRTGSIAVGLLAVFAFGALISIFGARGFQDVRWSHREYEDLRARVEAQQEKVVALRRATQRLRDDPTSMEGIAREQLGYARPGEVIFLLPREDSPVFAPTQRSILDDAPDATGTEKGADPEGRPGPG